MENPGRYHFNQVIEVNITNNNTYKNHVSSGVIYWKGAQHLYCDILANNAELLLVKLYKITSWYTSNLLSWLDREKGHWSHHVEEKRDVCHLNATCEILSWMVNIKRYVRWLASFKSVCKLANSIGSIFPFMDHSLVLVKGLVQSSEVYNPCQAGPAKMAGS